MHFTDEHEAFRAMVRDVVEREIQPYVDDWERAGAFPAHELFGKLGKLGLLGLEYDPAYGGQGRPTGSACSPAPRTRAVTAACRS